MTFYIFVRSLAKLFKYLDYKIFEYLLIFIFVISHLQGVKAYKTSQRLIRWPYKDFNHSNYFSGFNQSRRDFVNSGLCSPGQEYSKQARGEPEDIEERKDQGKILVHIYLAKIIVSLSGKIPI